MSANGISVGHAALVAARALQVAELTDAVAALSIEAVGGSISVVDAGVGEAKPIDGQIDAAAHMRHLLEGSYLQSHTVESVQEALSFRVVPQVHGALREVLAFAIAAVETEINAAGDNPLVTADGRIVHNGNFEPLVMAIALDAVRIALAHVGQLSERRMGHLWKAIFAHPEFLGSNRQPHGIKLRYSAAARAAELRQLAAPATLDVPPLDIGVEDHATGAPLSVSKTEAALDILEDILIVELLLTRDLLVGREHPVRLGRGTGEILGAADTVVDGLDPGAHPADVLGALREQLFR
jgi:histidine ammonia-lyase